MSGDYITVVRAAARQARIELRIQLFSPLVLGWLWFPFLGLGVMLFLKDTEVLGSSVSLAQLGIPGMLTLTLISGGVLGVAGQLLTERDDGTLLRAKSMPHGMLSHLLGNVLISAGTSLGPVILLLVPAAFLIPGITPTSASGWLLFLAVSVLGLTATLPWGALLGAVMKSPMMIAWTSLVVYGAMAIAGIFYPLAALPGWLQVIGQILPTYWIGLGMRSALLPPEAAALELGGSWHTAETIAILVLWTAVGMALAPGALKRMARRQSGSQVAAASERLMSRGY